MSYITENKETYIERFLCTAVPYFDNVFDNNYNGDVSFKAIQARLEEFVHGLYYDHMVPRAVHHMQFHNDSGVYHQRFGLEEHEARYDQFETGMIYSRSAAAITFTQGEVSITVNLLPNKTYMFNNQIEHIISTDSENRMIFFCFEASYTEVNRWYHIIDSK